jgi:hypothetical protein
MRGPYESEPNGTHFFAGADSYGRRKPPVSYLDLLSLWVYFFVLGNAIFEAILK